ncbi:mechanosensitive ion channel [Bacillus lacus]|uniref:Mechanosensitive ion channel n=1 Tax=Metabacillus lacus TaxID=1983721 RepID=A0A7X2IY90_9BACI|nr:mechanosensitive ion channel [Metabacillus lacus]MRX71864.1 mechanosensitive ion channel [Metabacillus lacus]
MNEVNNSLNNVFNTIIEAIPHILAALLLLILAFIVASVVRAIIVKGLKKIGVTRGMVRAKMTRSEEQAENTLKSIGNVLYFLIFILFLPSILDALQMNSVAQPITNMVQQFLAYLPNIFAAIVILLIGYFVARLIRDLVFNLLQSLNIDHWFDKLGTSTADARQESKMNKTTLAKVLSNFVFFIVLIPIITVALESLNIQSISQPIISVLNTVLNMIPNIFVAIILIIVGYYLAKFISELLVSLLTRTGVTSIYQSLGASDPTKSKFDISRAIGTVVKVLIILFFTVEALNVLQFQVLNEIGNAVIGYLPMIISALIILGLALIGGRMLENVIRNYSNSPFSAALVKYILITFAVFMALDQLGFASTIVNIGFLLILGALAVAFAISFGIGGREFAKRNLERFENKIQRDQNTPNNGQ